MRALRTGASLRGFEPTTSSASADSMPAIVALQLQRENLLDAGEIAGDGTDALTRRAGNPRGDRGEGLLPGRRAQTPSLAQVGLVEPLRAQAVDAIPGLVGDPLLVHQLVYARKNAHYFLAARIDADV